MCLNSLTTVVSSASNRSECLSHIYPSSISTVFLCLPRSISVKRDPSPNSSSSNSKVAVMDSGVIEGGLNVTLTIRLLMHGKVRSPISLSCQESIFYDLLFMERCVWCVKAEESDLMCVKTMQETFLNPQSRLIRLEVRFSSFVHSCQFRKFA